MARVIAAALALVLMLAGEARAWGAFGHRVTGVIAERAMDARTREAVRAILGDEPLAEAAVWADHMRRDPHRFWRHVAPAWHYVTVPDGLTWADIGPPPEGDAVTALELCARILRAPAAPPERRRLALRFAVHIIGDLHQPLHVGNGRDRGGNEVEAVFAGRRTNLHRLWDSVLPEMLGPSPEEVARTLLAQAPDGHADATATQPAVWIAEALALRPLAEAVPGGVTSEDAWARERLPVVAARLHLAGLRIAAWLAETLQTGRVSASAESHESAR